MTIHAVELFHLDSAFVRLGCAGAAVEVIAVCSGLSGEDRRAIIFEVWVDRVGRMCQELIQSECQSISIDDQMDILVQRVDIQIVGCQYHEMSKWRQ